MDKPSSLGEPSALRTNTSAALAEPPDDASRDVKRLAGGTGIALGGKIVGRGVRLFVDVALARLLGPFTFGLYALGWTVTRVVTLISPLGLNAGVIHFGSRHWGRDPAGLKGVVLECLKLALISGLIFSGAAWLAAPWLGAAVFHNAAAVPVFRCFALVFPLATGLSVAAAATRVSQRMKFSVATEDMGQPLIQFVLVLLLFFLWKRGLPSALIACVFSFGLAMGLALLYIKGLFPEVTSRDLVAKSSPGPLLAYSLPASTVGVLGVLLIWVDRLIVGYFRPTADVGIYQAASQLAVSFNVVLGAFGAIFAPMTAYHYHRGEVGRVAELYKVSTKWGLYWSLPPFLLICFASHQVMQVLYGKPYVAGWTALMILAFGQVIKAATGPVGTLLVMTGNQNQMFILSAVVFAVSVILGVILVPLWGMAGAASATALALMVLFVTAVYLAHRVFKMRPYDRRFLKCLAATAGAAGVMWMLRWLPIHSPLLVVALNLAVAVGVFALILRLLGLDAEDREFIALLRRRMVGALSGAGAGNTNARA